MKLKDRQKLHVKPPNVFKERVPQTTGQENLTTALAYSGFMATDIEGRMVAERGRGREWREISKATRGNSPSRLITRHEVLRRVLTTYITVPSLLAEPRLYIVS
jgi:hypothetical protein